MERIARSPTTRRRIAATERASQSPADGAALVDHRPGSLAQRQVAEAIVRSPRLAAQREQIEGMRAQPVTQLEVKTVAGVEVDVGGGYTNWDGWHINWQLGSKKNGYEQYHLTSQDRSEHYYFIIDGDDLLDTKPPAEFVPKKKKGHKVGGLSKAPAAVQNFIRTNIHELMG